MAETLFDPPPIYDLPLVKGQDLVVDFKNKTPGSNPAEFIDYPPGWDVDLVIEDVDGTVLVTAPAVVTDYHAVCRIETEVSDVIPKGLLWRVEVQIPGSPSTKRVPTNGVTVRYDGKAAR